MGLNDMVKGITDRMKTISIDAMEDHDQWLRYCHPAATF
jgi:hypothetical protein